MDLTTASSIDSQFVRNCCLNDDDICLGCGRSLREITAWSVASDEVKKRILEAATERRRLMSWLQST